MINLSKRLAVTHAVLVLIGCQGPATHDDTEPLTLSPHMRWGEVGSPPEQQFGSIRTFDADSSGSVYVADDYSQTVAKYDSTGRREWFVGGRGEAPGEFLRIAYVAVAFEKVYVMDGEGMRLSVFDAGDGSIRETVDYHVPNRGLRMNGAPRVLSPDSLVFGTLEVFPTPDPQHPDLPLMKQSMVLVSANRGILAQRALPDRREATFSYRRSDGNVRRLKLPFSPWQVWTPTPEGGLARAWGSEYDISVEGVTGEVRFTITRAVGPRKPSADAMSAARDWVVSALSGDMGVSASKRLPTPDPPQQIVSLAYSLDGEELWIGRTEWERSPVYDIMVDGTYRCTVELSAPSGVSRGRLIAPRVVNGRVFQHFRDEQLRVPFVAGFRVPDHCRQ